MAAQCLGSPAQGAVCDESRMPSDEPRPWQSQPQKGVSEPTASDRMLRWMGALAWIFWPAFFMIQIAANTATAILEFNRYGLGYQLWQVATWEASSNIVWLGLIPLILACWRRWPPVGEGWPAHVAIHVVAGLAVSVMHVLLMVWIRKLVYAANGGQYEFGPWPLEWAYEALKDIRTYALVVLIAQMWSQARWRVQGEASLPLPDISLPSAPSQVAPRSDPDPSDADELAAASAEPVRPAEHFLVKKLGREYLLSVAEIEWVQSNGNYVLLRFRGQDYPQRSTLSAMEQRLGPRFARVHRGYLINLSAVRHIEATAAGDARITTASGGQVPCSRTYLEGLRERLQ